MGPDHTRQLQVTGLVLHGNDTEMRMPVDNQVVSLKIGARSVLQDPVHDLYVLRLPPVPINTRDQEERQAHMLAQIHDLPVLG